METAVGKSTLEERVKRWGRELGFDAVAIAGTDLAAEEARLIEWLDRGWHGEMDYMARHGARRARPAELVPGTVSVITARLNYTPAAARDAWDVLGDPASGFVSRYALGRDYHKVLRAKLQALAERMRAELGPFHYRVFTDSAPVMEVALAAHAGLGWRGKHTLLLSRDAGSLYFLGELFVSLALARDPPASEHCGTCERVHRHLPDARHRGALPARRAPLHLVPHDRAPGVDSRGIARCHRQSHLRLRRLPARLSRGTSSRSRPIERDFAVRNGLDDAARWSISSPGARRSSTAASRAPRSGASATSAGCATSRWRWATRRRAPRRGRGACVARRDHPSPWCASTWFGRSHARNKPGPDSGYRTKRRISAASLASEGLCAYIMWPAS